MTIQIYEKNGRHLPLYFPIGFIRTELGSRLLAKIILQVVSQKGRTNGRERLAALGPKDSWPVWLDERVLCRLLRALGRCLGRYRGLTLAEVESADGDFVRIVL